MKKNNFPIQLYRLLLIPVCVYFLVSFLVLVASNFWPGPLFDYWVDVANIEKFYRGAITFDDLINAHNNAHRILIPRLLFILDFKYFSGTNVLLVFVSILCKLATLLLFNYILRNQSVTVLLTLNAFIFAALFNAGNVYNIIFNSDIQWDLVSVFACYAIYFYNRAITDRSALSSRLFAYLLLVLALLSHGGALSLPFVFIFIAILNKNYKEFFINTCLCITIFYANSVLPIADPENTDAQGALVTLLMHGDIVAIFIVKFFSAALAYHLGSPGLYFSIYISVLLLPSLLMAGKTRSIYNNLFLYLVLFLLLMMISIAAARAVFTPEIWAAVRFQTTVLLFILCLHIHAWLAVPVFFKERWQGILRALLLVHSMTIFLLVQYFVYNIPHKLSNIVFSGQSYMLTHGRNQNNGYGLLLWLHDKDVIADSDAFFRKNGFAWYANKLSGSGADRDFIDTGNTLLPAESISTFENSCAMTLSALHYEKIPDSGIEFSTSVDNDLTAIFYRQTYYALDENGTVVGAAYIYVNEDGFLKHPVLKGYSVNQSVRFIAETKSGKPVCLYKLQK